MAAATVSSAVTGASAPAAMVPRDGPPSPMPFVSGADTALRYRGKDGRVVRAHCGSANGYGQDDGLAGYPRGFRVAAPSVLQRAGELQAFPELTDRASDILTSSACFSFAHARTCLPSRR